MVANMHRKAMFKQRGLHETFAVPHFYFVERQELVCCENAALAKDSASETVYTSNGGFIFASGAEGVGTICLSIQKFMEVILSKRKPIPNKIILRLDSHCQKTADISENSLNFCFPFTFLLFGFIIKLTRGELPGTF